MNSSHHLLLRFRSINWKQKLTFRRADIKRGETISMLDLFNKSKNACQLPVSVAAALMPDAHLGYGTADRWRFGNGERSDSVWRWC